MTIALTPCSLARTSWLREPWGGISKNESAHPASSIPVAMDRMIVLVVFVKAFIVVNLKVFKLETGSCSEGQVQS
jgi:hypothetical protein